jgi:hypothetical protein
MTAPHSFIDKRGANQELPKPIATPPTETAPTSGKPEAATLVLTPFPDGTCMKMVKREFPGPALAKPEGFDQHILVNVVGDQLAITKNETIAHLICDAVNMLFAAQVRHQEEQAALVNLIAPTKDLPATQN